MRFCLFLRESRWIPELFQNHFLRFPSLPVIRAHYGDTLQLGFYGENDFPVEFPPPQHLNPHSDISFPVLHNPCALHFAEDPSGPNPASCYPWMLGRMNQENVINTIVE